MSQENTERTFYINWPIFLAYAGRFYGVIDNLEAVGCISGNLANETKKKIAELINLINIVTVTHDVDRENRAEDLFHVIMTTLFGALDNCFEKYRNFRLA